MALLHCISLPSHLLSFCLHRISLPLHCGVLLLQFTTHVLRLLQLLAKRVSLLLKALDLGSCTHAHRRGQGVKREGETETERECVCVCVSKWVGSGHVGGVEQSPEDVQGKQKRKGNCTAHLCWKRRRRRKGVGTHQLQQTTTRQGGRGRRRVCVHVWCDCM